MSASEGSNFTPPTDPIRRPSVAAPVPARRSSSISFMEPTERSRSRPVSGLQTPQISMRPDSGASAEHGQGFNLDSFSMDPVVGTALKSLQAENRNPFDSPLSQTRYGSINSSIETGLSQSFHANAFHQASPFTEEAHASSPGAPEAPVDASQTGPALGAEIAPETRTLTGRGERRGSRRFSQSFFSNADSANPGARRRSSGAYFDFARRRSDAGPAASHASWRRRSRNLVVAPDDPAGGEALDPNAQYMAPPLARRTSMYEMRRRSSQIWQVAYGNAEAPGYIRRGSTVVRRASVSSFKDFTKWTGAPQRRISIFEEDLDLNRQNIIDFIATVKTKSEKASKTPSWMLRSKIFPPLYAISILCILYFLFIGKPLWNGLAYSYWLYFSDSSNFAIGTIVFVSWAGLRAILPVWCCQFEQEVDSIESRDSSQVALIIPAYKAAGLLGPTIEHALKIFKKKQIFIIANGNSPTPLDNAAEVCAKYGVNHYWVPIGSKITAEFVGVAVAAQYKYVMLIDDDVHLPENLPIVANRLNDVIKCIGYTIKSTGADGIKGTYIQQCQDMEYKSSGLTRDWSGRWGSCTVPHGAIILWEREALQSLFSAHPGFVISEDWYFGHCARQAGYRITFCSQVFVETETPPCLLWDKSSARGGYGEMTVWKQRFYRWNYFFLFRVYDDMKYIIFNWRLGWRELVTKYQVMIEVMDSIMNLFRPFIFVMSFVLNWKLTVYYIIGLTCMYGYVFAHFNLVQLRKKNEMVSFKIMPYFFYMNFLLLWVGTASMYFGMWDYIKYFSKKHPKIIENAEALEAAYNIRLGTQLKPIADTVEEIIHQVEVVQHARADQDEITVLDRTPNSTPGDLEKGLGSGDGSALAASAGAEKLELSEASAGMFAGFSFMDTSKNGERSKTPIDSEKTDNVIATATRTITTKEIKKPAKPTSMDPSS